jgi:phage shock protein A
MFSSARRLIEAGVDGALSAAERLNSDGLMRQSIREVDSVLEDLTRQREQVRARATSAVARRRLVEGQVTTLHEQARFALTKGREDLAHRAVVEQLAAEREIAATREVEVHAAAEVQRIDDTLVELATRRQRLSDAYEAERKASDPARTSAAIDVRVGRAEASFDRVRAMNAASANASSAGAAAIADIETLSRDDTVAERLRELRAGLDPTLPKPRRAARRARG